MGKVLLGSVTLYWKKNGILFECFSREYFHVFLEAPNKRVMVATGRRGGGGEGLGSASPL